MTFEKQKRLPSGEAGQILLIVILTIIVASTVGLSLASRSITSLRTSTEEAESQKALAAAEAGIERAIQGSIPVEVSGNNSTNKSSYFTKITPVSGEEFLVNGGNLIPKDEGADIWFIEHDSSTGSLIYSSTMPSSSNPDSINLYWGLAGEDCASVLPAAIQAIIVVRNSATDIKSYRYAYDSCSRGNNFSPADDAQNYSIGNTSFRYRTPINSLGSGMPSPKNIVLIRVIPLYKDAVVGISSSISLPPQGYKVESTGMSGDASRNLTVFKGWPQTYLPYLSYGLFVAN